MTAVRHAPALRTLHWVTFTLLVVAFALIWWREGLDDSDARRSALAWHLTAGLCVLILTMARLLFRTVGTTLPQQPGLTDKERKASSVVHLSLYGLLLGTPVIGYLAVTTRGRAPGMFDALSLPALLERNRDLAEVLQDWHEWLAFGLLALAGLHLLGALYHHFVKKDGVLRSML